jgi:putative ABC transport system permease protein
VLLFYVWRSLIARLRGNALTMLSIVLFVVGSSVGLTVYSNLKGRLVDATPREHILVLANGAVSEEGSRLDLEAARKVVLLDGLKQDSGAALSTLETVGSVDVNTSNFARYEDPATIRGIDERSLKVHGVTLTAGTAPEAGTLQVIVGRRLAKRHTNLALGGSVFMPGGEAKISGIFEAGGSPYEDELWTPRSAFEVHLKQKYVSSLTVVAESEARVPELVAKINGTKEYSARAIALKNYRESGSGLETILRTVLVLVLLLSIVATSAIATTMNAAVSVRLPEFAAMIAIGIRRGVIARTVLAESLLLAMFGSVLGVAIAELIRNVIGTVKLGAYPIDLDAVAIVPVFGLVLGVIVGLLGGVAPMIQIRRLDIIRKLR